MSSDDGVGDSDAISSSTTHHQQAAAESQEMQQQARPPLRRARRSSGAGLSRAYAGRSATFADLRALNNPFSQSSAALLAKKRSLVDLSTAWTSSIDEEAAPLGDSSGSAGGGGATAASPGSCWLLLEEEDGAATQQHLKKRLVATDASLNSSSSSHATILEQPRVLAAAPAAAVTMPPAVAHRASLAAAPGSSSGSGSGRMALARHSWDGSGITGPPTPPPHWMQPGGSSQLAAQPSWPQEASCPLPTRSASPSVDSCCSGGGAAPTALFLGSSGSGSGMAAQQELCFALNMAALSGGHIGGVAVLLDD